MADMTSYNILLKACCIAGRVELAQEIYREVKHLESKGVLKLDVFTYSTIVKVTYVESTRMPLSPLNLMTVVLFLPFLCSLMPVGMEIYLLKLSVIHS